ncbi:MAG: hypothetical protein KCHDKBKB_02749 [Elusimicrobia bacterium]|nr:hypothetical protein [Elusimicrobiota bacterium]
MAVLILALAAGMAGSYLFLRRFLEDRQTAMSYRDPASRNSTTVERKLPDGRTVRTTTENLEEARKQGQQPTGTEPFQPTQAATANDAAVQRTLRTLEEINKINEMNRRLQEQQQRNR